MDLKILAQQRAAVVEDVHRAVGRRLDVAAGHLLRAIDLADKYIEIGCPPPRHVERLTLSEEAAGRAPSLLGQARQQLTRGCINIEAAMLALMAVPAHNTRGAVSMAKTIKGLSKGRRRRIEGLLEAHALLDHADREVKAMDGCKSRVDLRSCARIVKEKVTLAARAVDKVAG